MREREERFVRETARARERGRRGKKGKDERACRFARFWIIREGRARHTTPRPRIHYGTDSERACQGTGGEAGHRGEGVRERYGERIKGALHKPTKCMGDSREQAENRHERIRHKKEPQGSAAGTSKPRPGNEEDPEPNSSGKSQGKGKQRRRKERGKKKLLSRATRENEERESVPANTTRKEVGRRGTAGTYLRRR